MNKKISIFAVILALSCIAMNSFALSAQSKHSAFLTVINNWFYTIQVKEGWIWKREGFAYSGTSINWQMYTGTISNLAISYWRDGRWQLIPGCPRGDYKYGLFVYVTPAPWDPNTPICMQR